MRGCGREVHRHAGALTPTEILTAWKAGADVVKVFPAGAVGGASYLAAGAFALGVGADLVSGTNAEITDKARQYAAAVAAARR